MSARRGPLSGRRVLITRARQDAAELASLLEERGATVLALPTITIQPPEDLAPLDSALGRLGAYDWIAFTSRNAVRAVFGRLQQLGGQFPATLRIAAVGPSTAAEIQARGVTVQLQPAESTGAALAAELGAGVRGQCVLLPVGNLARPDLRIGLEQAGAQVDQVAVYRTVRPPEVDHTALAALRVGAVDAVALASPSAVRHLVEMLDGDVSCLRLAGLVCIGRSTAAALGEYGFEPAAVAGRPTQEGLVDAIVEVGISRAER